MKTLGLFNAMIVTGLVLGLVSSMKASSGQPLEVLRDKIEQGLAILNDPCYQSAEDRSGQAKRIWQLSREIFDDRAMSRRVLSSRWHDFSPAQQQAFVREFPAFLRRTYLPLLLEKYDGQQVEYVRQNMESSRMARVDLLVLWRERKIPVSARMIRRHGQWKIYDISALGFSAVMNYRAQLHWLLQEETPDRVIEILKSRKGRWVNG